MSSDREKGGIPRGDLSALLLAIARAPDADARPMRSRLAPGERVGRFEVLREIGRGGFGVVYEALDPDLGRKVALKALRPSRPGHELSAEWLRREAEAAARLDHPGLVTLFEAGLADGLPWLAMELLKGETLGQRLEREPLEVREAVGIALEMARALGHAHARGVVHRDLKPANVFLTEEGRVKLLDLGLAHLLGTRETSHGGTPAFMAPEQCRGEAGDARTDVFALGAVLYTMLAGHPPFEVKDGRSAALERATAEPLPRVAPRALARLVARCLSHDPDARPTSGQAVAEELLAIQRALERPRVRRVRVAALSAALVAVALAAAAALWRSRPHPDRSSDAGPVTLAVLPLANLSGDPAQDYFSDGMTAEIIGKLSRLPGLAVAARTSVARYKGSTSGPREIGGELRVAYVLEGAVRRGGDRVRVTASLVKTADAFPVWSEDIDARAGDLLEVQEHVATRIVQALDVHLSREDARALGDWGTRNATAYDSYLRGEALVQHFDEEDKLAAARGHFERALAADPKFAPAMAGLASSEAQTYRNFDSDPARLARGDALVARALAIDPRLVRARMAAGQIRGMRFDYAGAAEEFRRVVAEEPRNYVGWDALCWVLGYRVPPALNEAEQACRRALEISPGFGEAYYHLARVLAARGQFDEAEQAIVQLAELNPGLRLIGIGRYWIAMARGRPREALAQLPESQATGVYHAWRAMALAQMGERARALEALERAFALGYRDTPDLRRSPYLAPLRADPRFERLLAKYGIAP